MEKRSMGGGRYTIVEKLGEGSSKEVFLAKDETLHREVALCVFKKHTVSGDYIDRVRREARVLAGLNHPNIVGVFDFREDDGWYLITENVGGGSLKSKLASHHQKGLELSEALRIGAEVADALGYAHAMGVFHRDVKPSNVMLTSEGTAKLGDFGLARPFGDESLTESDLIVGTVPYMSPEQAKGLPPDSPSDMYSFGVLLYEMVTGRRPFHGEDVSVLVHHLNSTPPPPTRYVPTCPPRLEALILKLLDKQPEARPRANDVAQELRSIQAEVSAGEKSVMLLGAPDSTPGPASGGSSNYERREAAPMDDSAYSDSQIGASSQSADSKPLSVESLSVESIKKGLLSDALQHPATIIPAFLFVLWLLYLLIFSDFVLWSIIVLIVPGMAAVGSFSWRYFVRYNEEYARRTLEIMEIQDLERQAAQQLELVRMRETLRNGFSSIASNDGLKALDQLVNEYERLQARIQRMPGSDQMFVAQIPALAEETYRQGLRLLQSVLELILAIHLSDKKGLEADISRLHKEIETLGSDESQSSRVEIRKSALASHMERLELLNQQELRAEEFLYRSNLSEAALQRTRIELAALTAGSSETGVNAVGETLRNTIEQAKEVQEELRRLGY